MKNLPLILFVLLALSACGPLPPAPTLTPDPSPTGRGEFTPTATITPSPTVTFTPTATPTPSPPEIAAADFARYNFSTEGLKFETGADGVTRAIDPETGEVVYEDGEFKPEFVAGERLKVFKLAVEDYAVTVNADGQVEAKGKPGTKFAGKVVLRGDAWNMNEIARILEHGNLCKPTDFKLDPNEGTRTQQISSILKDYDFTQYRFGLIEAIWFTKEAQAVNPGRLIDEDRYALYDFFPIPVENTDQCWVIFIRPNRPVGPWNFAVFETNEGKVMGVPVFMR